MKVSMLDAQQRQYEANIADASAKTLELAATLQGVAGVGFTPFPAPIYLQQAVSLAKDADARRAVQHLLLALSREAQT